MPEYRHPRAAAVAIDLGGERVVCDDDGVFEAPGDDAVRAFARAYDTTADELRVDGAEMCEVEKSDGEVCGRELPCPYHSDTED